MGAKKKPQVQPQKQTKPTIASNKMRTLKTNDGGSFQISDNLLSKFSSKLRKKVEQFKGDETVDLQDIDKVTFKYIEEFLLNRKDKELGQIHFPIRSNISLKFIMDESDAVLMQKIDREGGMQQVHKLLDAATNLQMQDLRKRLFCLVAMNLSQNTVDQLKELYDIPNIDLNEDALRKQTKAQLEQERKNIEKKMQEQ